MTQNSINQQLSALTQKMLAGQFESVEFDCNRLLTSQPNDPRLLCLLGRVQRLQGKRTEARQNLLKAVQFAPRAAQVLSELGYLALEEEQYATAEESFRALTQFHSQLTDGWFNLGIALRQQGKHIAAINALEKCLVANTALEQVHTELGTAHIMQRHEEKALEHFNEALELKPDYAPALHGVGMAHSAFGDFDSASEHFRKAISSDPDFVDAYQQLVSIRRFEGDDDPDIQTMEKIVADPLRQDLTRETLHYALGKVYDDCQLHEQAFTHFAKANALKKQRLPVFSAERLSSMVNRLIDQVDQDLQLPFQNKSKLPILIFGMPRSGTTLVEQVLASHSKVNAGGEQTYIERATRTALAPYPESLATIEDKTLMAFADDYLEQLQSCRSDGDHVTDKMPANFFHVGLAHKVFPNAKLIYCRRNRLDNALSIYFQNMPTGHHYANDLSEIDIYYREQERLMQYWLKQFGAAIHVVDYEDFVADFHAGVTQLLKYCGLNWEDQCLDYKARKGPVATLSLWQVRQPIYNRSVARWKHYASHFPEPMRQDD